MQIFIFIFRRSNADCVCTWYVYMYMYSCILTRATAVTLICHTHIIAFSSHHSFVRHAELQSKTTTLRPPNKSDQRPTSISSMYWWDLLSLIWLEVAKGPRSQCTHIRQRPQKRSALHAWLRTAWPTLSSLNNLPVHNWHQVEMK